MKGVWFQRAKAGQETKCSVTLQTVGTREPKQAVCTKKSSEMTQHVKPLYIQAYMNGRPISKVQINNGLAINVMPIKMVQSLGKIKDDLLSSKVTIIAFIGDVPKAMGVLPIEIIVGTLISATLLFVVNSEAIYRMLLGKDQIHANACILSSLHQVLLFQKGKEVEIVQMDEDPFKAQTNMINACYYYTSSGPLKIQPRANSKQEGHAMLMKKEDKQLKQKVLVHKTQGDRRHKASPTPMKRDRHDSTFHGKKDGSCYNCHL